MKIDNLSNDPPRSYVGLAVLYRKLLEDHPTEKGALFAAAMNRNGQNQVVALENMERAYMRFAQKSMAGAAPRYDMMGTGLSVPEFRGALENSLIADKTLPDPNRAFLLE